MKPEKKLCELLKVNSGSKLHYDHKAEMYVITYNKAKGFSYFGDWELRGDILYKENSDKPICAVKHE